MLAHDVDQLKVHSPPLLGLDLLLVPVHLLELLVLRACLVVETSASSSWRASEGRLIPMVGRYLHLKHEDLVVSDVDRLDTGGPVEQLPVNFYW